MKKAGKEEIKTFIKERLAELLNIDPQSIDENAFLVEDLGTTSIMIVDLLVAVEEEYGEQIRSGRTRIGESCNRPDPGKHGGMIWRFYSVSREAALHH